VTDPQPQPQPAPAPEGPHVRIIRDHQVLREVRVTRALRIGRLPDNDLVIDDEQVSGHHGRIERVGPGWRYTDLGSRNGSIVAAGPTLHAQQSVPLDEDLQILLGTTVLDVRVQDGRDVADRPVAAQAPLRPRVVAVLDGRARRLPLPEPRAVLGRGPGVDVALVHGSVSQRHCEIRREGAGFVVADLGSTNGTRLGVERLSAPRALPSGSHLIVGEVDLLFVHDGPEPDADERLRLLVRRGRLGRVHAVAARRALERGGVSLGEVLVLSGAMTPGAWVEAEAATQDLSERRFPLRTVLAAVLAGAVAALAWLLATR
jgi:pSer/pThr/pTyr-binding forkhead associated (FHA) protein